MTVFELIQQLLPDGTQAYASGTAVAGEGASGDYSTCPSWPVDLFAVVGSLIERSGCYTMASPDRTKLREHEIRLDEISNCARIWNSQIREVPGPVESLWATLIQNFGGIRISEIRHLQPLVSVLLAMFAIADEASAGIGWDVDPEDASQRMFASIAFANLTKSDTDFRMPYTPTSLCVMVPPERAIVLPKSITSSVGCTIRSLSHHLALLPAISVLEPQWFLSGKKRLAPTASQHVRLLLIPFPFTIHATSFEVSSAKQAFGDNNLPAYFALRQRWLEQENGELTGQRLADDLVLRLVDLARKESGEVPNGVILPECALTSRVAGDLAAALVGSGIEFLITGVLDTIDGKHYNRALTFAFEEGGTVGMSEQNKQHRWRLDRGQTERYGLHFDDDLNNNQWWEDIDVSQRKLPFFALRKDMSLMTLICEDLARTDPAMSVVRAVGPNLVVALLMDGPQLAVRWPGRYATVLAEDPGSAVLTLTCAAMVDRSNWLEAKPARSIGLWRDGSGRTQEIGLPDGASGIVLTLHSKPKHQTTLDNRSDKSLSRQLTLRTVVPLQLAELPDWL